MVFTTDEGLALRPNLYVRISGGYYRYQVLRDMVALSKVLKYLTVQVPASQSGSLHGRDGVLAMSDDETELPLQSNHRSCVEGHSVCGSHGNRALLRRRFPGRVQHPRR